MNDQNQIYPETCLRGLPHYEDYMDNTGQPGVRIFRPHDAQMPRGDGWYELSVNWEHPLNPGEPSVEDMTLQERVGTNLKYTGGAVRIRRDILDAVIQIEPCMGIVSYERQELENNRFHGNILVHKSLDESKAKRKAVRGQLLKSVVHHVIQRYEQGAEV